MAISRVSVKKQSVSNYGENCAHLESCIFKLVIRKRRVINKTGNHFLCLPSSVSSVVVVELSGFIRNFCVLPVIG